MLRRNHGQVPGTGAGRSVFGEDLWIRLLLAAGGTVIGMDRPGLGANTGAHASEAVVRAELIDRLAVDDGNLDGM